MADFRDMLGRTMVLVLGCDLPLAWRFGICSSEIQKVHQLQHYIP